jgi:hypothetical protein
VAKKPEEAPEGEEVVLLRTVNYGGTYYPPGEVLKLPGDIADELIDVEAAEPVLVVALGREKVFEETNDD